MKNSTFCLAASVIFTLPAILSADPPKERRLPITISKETTYITEPLRLDGYPDYLAALNRMASEGVTPENNAAVALLRIFGPDVLEDDFEKKYTDAERKKFYDLLGIDPLPEKGDYFVEYEDYVRQHDPDALKEHDADGHWRVRPSYEEQERAGNRPWSEEECPLVAGWLVENERHLAKIIEASRRPRWFVPIVLRNQWREGLCTHQYYSFIRHEAANAFASRAMLHVHKGRVKEARADLLARHRLGRLLAQGASVTDCVMGVTVEEATLSYDRQLAHYGKPSLEQTRAFWKEINGYQPLPSLIKTYDVYGRFKYLDALCAAISGDEKARDVFAARRWVLNMAINKKTFESKIEDEYKVFPNTMLAKLIRSGEVDWNRVLRLGNEYYDQKVEAATEPTWDECVESFKKIDSRIKKLVIKSATYKHRKTNSDGNSDSEKPDLAELVSANCLASFSSCDPHVLLIIERRNTVLSQLTEISLALGAYRSEHFGVYPVVLSALQPKYIKQFPKDTYGDGRFRYRRDGDGFVLYSVGPDGKDNSGHGRLSQIPPYTSKGDDYGIQVGHEFDEEEEL